MPKNKNDLQDFVAIPELAAGAYVEIFKGVQKCSFGMFLLCECQRHNYSRVSGHAPRKNFVKLYSNICDFSAFWNHLQSNFFEIC